nr:MAG: structural polyprotein [Dicistroviridae sp.]
MALEQPSIYPGKHISEVLFNWTFFLNNSIAEQQNFNATPDLIDATTADKQETLVHRDDGELAHDDFVTRMCDMPRAMYTQNIDATKHSITNFLGRPAIIRQGTWSSSQPRGAKLTTVSFPKDLLNNIYNITQNTRKVDGFVGIKAKVNVRLEVSSQPFQAGALLLSYIPYADYMNSHTQWINGTTTTNVFAASGCPHVVMNLANTAAMSFTTPYVAPYLYANLVSGQGSFGTVTISVISPLSTQSASSVNWTLWAHFEDVELVYPTPAPLVDGTGWAQIGGEMAKMENRGSIAQAVGTVGRLTSSVLPYVGLKYLAKPVEAFSTTAESVLKYFGFSKPTVTAPVTRVLQSPARFFLNSDGADACHKLSLSATNELQTFPGFAGTDEDEMRFDYVAARPCFTTSFEWNTGNAADESIYLTPITPMGTITFDSPTLNAYATPCTMPLAAKVASTFDLWRGDMVYTFHFVKTQFHNGRLRISFLPYSYEDTATMQNMPAYAYTEDIDISTSSSFTFRVPYTSVRPWLHTLYNPDVALTATDARNFACGTIQVSVINPLVAASTVASKIDVMVFTSLENAQFAGPRKSTLLPYNIPNVAQVGGERTKESSDATSETPQLPMLPYASCVGEVVTSYRQLLKRFSQCGSITPTEVPPTALTLGSSGDGFVLFPWQPVRPQVGSFTVSATGSMTPKYSNNNDSIGTSITTIPDLYSQAYCHYGFYRGSMRYKLVVSQPSTTWNREKPISVFINMYSAHTASTFKPEMYANSVSAISNLGTGPIQLLLDKPKVSSTTLKTNFSYQPGFTEHSLIVYPDKEGVIEFEVPFLATGHMVPTSYGRALPDRLRSIVYPLPTVTVYSGGVGGLKDCGIDVYRAIGDDFSFGSLIGVPTHAYWKSTADPQ